MIGTEMAKERVPFFINKNNQEYLLDGKTIDNFDEVFASMLFSHGTSIFKEREDPKKYESELPDNSDFVKAKALKVESDDNGYYLLIELIDTLYFYKLKEPCIKINGTCVIEDNKIHITDVQRLTLADRQKKSSFIE